MTSGEEWATWTVSNLGWAQDDQGAALALLSRSGIQGIEISPGLAFPSEQDRLHPSERALQAFKSLLRDHGLCVSSMQSLLYDDNQALLFGTPRQRRAFETRMTAAIDLAGRMQIPSLAFGSPANRSFPGEAIAAPEKHQAAAIFRCLGDACVRRNCQIGIEPVAASHGTNFLNTLSEALAFVCLVDHPAIGLTLDTGAMIENGDLAETLSTIDTRPETIAHVQISAPGLAGFPTEVADVRLILSRLQARGYRRAVSLEMRRIANGDVGTLERAMIAFAELRALE